MGKMIELTAADGHKLAAYRADPAGKPRGGLIVIMEIFGVNSHIRSVADGYAKDGYLVIAPAMFDRLQRNLDTGYSQKEIEAGIALMQKAKVEDAMADVGAALKVAKEAGKVGIIGYCWGGFVSWMAAARVPGLACSAPHYGGGVTDNIGEQPKCPVMLHFGEKDGYIPMDGVHKLKAAHPKQQVFTYPADHGFNCDQRGSYHAESAKLARERTLEFFRKNIG
ncbi:MAG: dienelactone hydrolase family protein [Burkholderiales bacterium]